MKPDRKEAAKSNEDLDTVATDTVTASTGMDSDAVRATAGATPPRHVRGSSLTKSKPSKDKKTARPQTKAHKQATALSRSRSHCKVNASKRSGTRSAESKMATTLVASLPPAPSSAPSPAPSKRKKSNEEDPAGPALSSPSASESLVTLSKEGSYEEQPPLPSSVPGSSQKETPSLPKEANKTASYPWKLQECLHAGYSQDGSSVSPQTRERMESDPHQTAPFMDILVENLREVAQGLGGSRWSWQLGAPEETSAPKPHFGFVARSSSKRVSRLQPLGESCKTYGPGSYH
ncbi:hypothetical protein HPB52_004039 [Rhipicephalus sanguineus]|uniref:Uncharacterized protein n=1 Tax=Rhipicephalus sanguineus TaxID=34632 RepID=A0A9D4T6Z5_RHISA|nr:hypothetical protein HPB52_004039 [Rhipicephalus sanguineus]